MNLGIDDADGALQPSMSSQIYGEITNLVAEKLLKQLNKWEQ